MSCGLSVFALLWIFSKRELIHISPLISALIGVGAALLVGGVLFLILRPTSRRVARYVDD